MGSLCETFGKIARKNARLRDTTDCLVGVLNEYSAKEKINTSSKKGLYSFSSFLSAVEDYRNAMVSHTTVEVTLKIYELPTNNFFDLLTYLLPNKLVFPP